MKYLIITLSIFISFNGLSEELINDKKRMKNADLKIASNNHITSLEVKKNTNINPRLELVKHMNKLEKTYLSDDDMLKIAMIMDSMQTMNFKDKLNKYEEIKMIKKGQDH